MPALEDRAADGSVGRAKDSCTVSGNSPDPFIGLGDLGLDAGGVQLGQIRMVIGMISQFAADFLHFTDGIRIRRNFLPQHKKGGVGIVFLQLGQKLHGSGAGPVVKGQSDGRFVRIDLLSVFEISFPFSSKEQRVSPR